MTVDVSTGATYERVVLAVDTDSQSEPALSIAAALGDSVGSFELLTITADDLERAGLRLQRLADRHVLRSTTCTTLPGSDIGAAVAHEVTLRPGALLVIGSTGRGTLTLPSDRHPSRSVLAHVDQPTLVVGDRVDPRFEPHQGTVVVLHDGQVREAGSCDDVLTHPTDPYTQRLLAASRFEEVPA